MSMPNDAAENAVVCPTFQIRVHLILAKASVMDLGLKTGTRTSWQQH